MAVLIFIFRNMVDRVVVEYPDSPDFPVADACISDLAT